MVELKLYDSSMSVKIKYIRVRPGDVSSVKDNSKENLERSTISLTNGSEFEIQGDAEFVELELYRGNDSIRIGCSILAAIGCVLVGSTWGGSIITGAGLALVVIPIMWIKWTYK